MNKITDIITDKKFRLGLAVVVALLLIAVIWWWSSWKNDVQEHFNGYDDRVLYNKNGFWGQGPDNFTRAMLEKPNLYGKGGEKYMGLFYSVEDATDYARQNNIAGFTLHGSSLGVWANTAWAVGKGGVGKLEQWANEHPYNDVFTVIVDLADKSDNDEGNVAYCKVRVDDDFEVFYNNKLITSSRKMNPNGPNWNRTFDFKIPNVQPDTNVWFHCLNTGGPGSFIAEIKLGNKTVYTSPSTVVAEGFLIQTPYGLKRIGGKYLGCWHDRPNERDLENYGGDVNNSIECAQRAYNAGKRYFGLQYGRQCWYGNRYGEHGWRGAHCSMKNPSSHEIFGGSNLNSVFDLDQKPDIIEVPGDRNGFSKAVPIWVNNREQYGKVDFSIKLPTADKVPYCPKIDYEGFNPAACMDPFNCERTALANFTPTDSLCGRKYDYSDYDKVYREIASAWEVVGSVDSKIRTSIENAFDMNRDDLKDCDKETKKEKSLQYLVMRTDVINQINLKTDVDNPGLEWANGFISANYQLTRLLKPVAEKLNYPIDTKQLTEAGDIVPDTPLYYSLIDRGIRYITKDNNILRENFITSVKNLVDYARIINGNPKQVRECNCLEISNSKGRQCVPC